MARQNAEGYFYWKERAKKSQADLEAMTKERDAEWVKAQQEFHGDLCESRDRAEKAESERDQLAAVMEKKNKALKFLEAEYADFGKEI